MYVQFQLFFAVIVTETFQMNANLASAADVACCAFANVTAKSASIRILHCVMV